MRMRRYRDIYGDVWEKINEFYVRRIRDGNIGLWMDGKGLQ